jgi:hypothetical protein
VKDIKGFHFLYLIGTLVAEKSFPISSDFMDNFLQLLLNLQGSGQDRESLREGEFEEEDLG